MRWSTNFALFLLLRAWETTAEIASFHADNPIVYLYDPRSSSSSDTNAKQESVTPSTARAIIAQRLGLAAYNDIGDIGDSDLQSLNRYGRTSQVLFGGETSDGPEHIALVILEGLEPLSSMNNIPGLTSFQMNQSPSEKANRELVDIFYDYAAHKSDMLPSLHMGNDDFYDGAMESLAARCYIPGKAQSGGTLLHCLQDISDSPSMTSFATELLRTVEEKGITLALIMNPKPAERSRTKSNIYGQLSPAPEEQFVKRQEEPLVEPTTAMSRVAATSSKSQSSATSIASFPLTPGCYDSSDACMSETNSCSGHGECVLTRKGPPSSKDDEAAECYQCKCKPKVVKNDDGSTKTTYYGGSACHKEDISAPFWILTVTAGSLIALVGFGVSMLYAMGNVELPSVIGAGVSGPRAK